MRCDVCGSTEFVYVQGEAAIAAFGAWRCAYFFSHGLPRSRPPDAKVICRAFYQQGHIEDERVEGTSSCRFLSGHAGPHHSDATVEWSW